MMQLRTEKGVLQMNKDAFVQITCCNPALDTDASDRSFSYPVTVPMTAHNQVLLGFPNRVDSPMETNIPLSLHLSGSEFERGMALIEEANDRTASLTFQSNTRQFLSELEKVQVAPLLQTIEIQQFVEAFWLFDCEPPMQDRSYYIEINDVSFYIRAVGTDTKATILSKVAQAINARFPAMASVKDAWSSSPQLKLTPVYNGVKVGFSEGFRLSGHRLESTARQENMQTFLRTQLPHRAIALPQYTHLGFYGEKNPYFSGLVNRPYENAPNAAPVFQYNIVPMVRLSYVLSCIETALNVRFQFDFPNSEHLFSELLIYSNYAVDSVIEEWTVGAQPKKQFVNVHQKAWQLSDLVPKWNAKQWILNICTQFALCFQLKGNTVVCTKKNRVFQYNTVDMSQYVVEMISKQRNESKGYALDFVRNEHTPENLVGWNVGGSSTQIEFPFSTFSNVHITGLGGSSFESIGTKPHPVALIFDTFSFENPYFSLLIQGEKGLLETFFRGIVETLGGTTYQLMMLLPAHRLIELRGFNENWYIRLPTGAFRCVVKETTFKGDLKQSSTIVVKVDCVTY